MSHTERMLLLAAFLTVIAGALIIAPAAWRDFWHWLRTPRLKPIPRYIGHHSEPYLDDQYADDIDEPQDPVAKYFTDRAAVKHGVIVHLDEAAAARAPWIQAAWDAVTMPNKAAAVWPNPEISPWQDETGSFKRFVEAT